MAKLVRAYSSFLDEELGEVTPVLDHGYIIPIDYMGNETSIIKAAGVSYGSGTKKVSSANALLRYLMRHRHSSPFEQAAIAFEIKLPIFVARQWLRHRMAHVNEYSMRYSLMINSYYMPDFRTQSKTNKQGSESLCSDELNEEFKRKTKELLGKAFSLYDYLVSEDNNVTRELARIILPLNIYTKMVWSSDIHNLIHFCSLRSKPNAQEEIRVYSDVILHKYIKGWMPNVYEAFMDFRFNAVTLSGPVMECMQKALLNPIAFYTTFGQELEKLYHEGRITKREVDEALDAFKGDKE